MPTTSVATACAHHKTSDYYSEGGTLLGGDCKSCGLRYGVGICDGCEAKKRLWVLVEAREIRRYCSEDCCQQAKNRAAKARARTVGGKAKGRK